MAGSANPPSAVEAAPGAPASGAVLSDVGVSKARRTFAWGFAASVLGLIYVGALVKSHDAGLAEPDWPLGYDQLWPEMVGGVFYEHGHRAVATAVGLLALGAAIWTQCVERRRWVKALVWTTGSLVAVQAVLGGLTVLYLLPPLLSASHGTLAQIILCLGVWVALAVSSEWRARPGAGSRGTSSRPALLAAGVACTAVFVQLILGAIMRHHEAGLAVPFFPVDVDGSWLPVYVDGHVWIHMAHRTFAAVVLLLVWRACRAAGRADVGLTAHAGALALIVLVQAVLGASVIWTGRGPAITSLHVANGALVLALSWALALRLWLRVQDSAGLGVHVPTSPTAQVSS